MNNPRAFLNMTVLPDDNVLVDRRRHDPRHQHGERARPTRPSCGRRRPAVDDARVEPGAALLPLDRGVAARRPCARRWRLGRRGRHRRPPAQLRDLLAAVPLQGSAADDRVRARHRRDTARRSRSPRPMRRTSRTAVLIAAGGGYPQLRREQPLRPAELHAGGRRAPGHGARRTATWRPRARTCCSSSTATACHRSPAGSRSASRGPAGSAALRTFGVPSRVGRP